MPKRGVSGSSAATRRASLLCTFKRLIDIYSSTTGTIDALMKLELPSGVEVEIKV